MASEKSTDPKTTSTSTDKPEDAKKANPAALEEDDEFEDFPVDDWQPTESEAQNTTTNSSAEHLWEESWDDDDTSDDFSNQLREELKKVEGSKRR